MYNNLSIDELKELLIEKDKLLAHKDRVSILGENLEELSEQLIYQLSSISMSANNLQMKKILGLLTDDIFQNELDNIIKNADFLSQSICDLSTFCKNKSYNEVLNLNVTIKKVISIVASNLKAKNIELITFLDNELFFKGCENELMQVLLNLLNNALDVLLLKPKNDRQIIIKLTQNKEKNIIMIEDNGGGINNELIDKIFDKYFTTKGDKGSGLGLFVSKQIIHENLKGSMKVYNTNKGACFIIELPIYEFVEQNLGE